MKLNIPFPRVELAHKPTALEFMPNLTRHLSGPQLWIKRDDCTGLAMGGNKARQLEYYLGQAQSIGADTVLTTGAVQSNHVRMTIAAARKLGMDVEVQLEKRVQGRQQEYYDSGNPFLMRLMTSKIYHYPVGEDEEGADKALYERAEKLKQQRATPYVVPLSGNHTPYGALAYVEATEEILQQLDELSLSIDTMVVASGSANTHAGLLFGLRMLDSNMRVIGMCVRRSAELQFQRVLDKTQKLAQMMKVTNCVSEQDIEVNDVVFLPGYGQLNDPVIEAIKLTAQHEGILLDPTYTGKAMAGLIDLVRQDNWTDNDRVLFIHTGGAPALFGYPELLEQLDCI